MEKPINLTEKELAYLMDQDFLKAKFAITDKVFKIFSIARNLLKEEVGSHPFPNRWIEQPGKISKGENYRQLPYIVLDYPRYFTKSEIFSYRTMFWWGNFFSFTLHLQGEPLNRSRKNLLMNNWDARGDVYVCVNHTPWEYHYEPDNYRLISDMPEAGMENVIKMPFVKISRKTALRNWQDVPGLAVETFRLFMETIRG